MTFGEKLKKLRNDNQLTQDELAEKIFVTRTAISKWETDKGYPSIDSLKQLSNLFHISIDELISDTDIENKRLLDEAQSRKFYWFAIACLAVATVSAVINYFTKIPYLNIISFSGVVGYIALIAIQAQVQKNSRKKNGDPVCAFSVGDTCCYHCGYRLRIYRSIK